MYFTVNLNEYDKMSMTKSFFMLISTMQEQSSNAEI